MPCFTVVQTRPTVAILHEITVRTYVYVAYFMLPKYAGDSRSGGGGNDDCECSEDDCCREETRSAKSMSMPLTLPSSADSIYD
jgi:hypothetical protein